jgi:hypothetical protein
MVWLRCLAIGGSRLNLHIRHLTACSSMASNCASHLGTHMHGLSLCTSSLLSELVHVLAVVIACARPCRCHSLCTSLPLSELVHTLAVVIARVCSELRDQLSNKRFKYPTGISIQTPG